MGIFKKTHQKIIEYRWKKFVEENKDAASKYICGSYSEPSLKKKYKYKSPFVYRTPSIEDVLKNRELILSNYELEKTYRKVCDLVENYPYGTAVICRDKFRLCFIDVERMPGQVISKYAESKGYKPIVVFGEGLPIVGIDDFDAKFCEKLLGYRTSIETENRRIESLLHAEDIKNDFEDSILANEKRSQAFVSFLQQNGKEANDKEYCIKHIAELDAYVKQQKQGHELIKTIAKHTLEQENETSGVEVSSGLVEKNIIEKWKTEIRSFNLNVQSASQERRDLLMKTYPKVVYSEQIQEIVSGKPKLPTEPDIPVKPKCPEEPNVTNPFWIIAIIAALVIIVISYSDDYNNSGDGSMVFGIILCWVFMIALFIAAKKRDKNDTLRTQYKNEVREYNEALLKYNEARENYAKKKRNYDDAVKEITSDKYIKKWRREEMDKLLGFRIKPKYEDCNGEVVKKGRLDDYFANRLMHYGYEVVENKKIPVGNTYYYPDVLVKIGNLYIDIEIDEPYAIDTGEPIHYLLEHMGDSVDFDRDFYLSSCGFEVIRFAEESVALHPKSCVSYINEVVKSIYDGKEVAYYNSDIEVKRWSKEEAEEMSRNDYRNVYLSVLNDKM